MREPLRMLMAGRLEGKTTQAVAWVSHGARVGGYPGWSRVLVLATDQDFQRLRGVYWPRLDDFDHRVYSLDVWARARSVGFNVEVCVDDLDRADGGLVQRMPGVLVAATITAEPWEEQTFVERVVAERSEG